MIRRNELYDFPCKYPIKVIGPSTETFEKKIIAIMHEQIGVIEDSSISRKVSKNGNYLSITFTIMAESFEQLEKIYTAIKSYDQVLMTL